MQTNSAVINVYSTELPIPVENCVKRWPSDLQPWSAAQAHSQVSGDGRVCSQGAIRACSACAGDYEDPDRTAWTSGDSDGDEDKDTQETSAEGFPVES